MNSLWRSTTTQASLAARVADVRLTGQADEVATLLARPMYDLARGEHRNSAHAMLILALDEACSLSGVTRQPSAAELGKWADMLLVTPDWSSLPIVAIVDFCKAMATGRWVLYDRLTLAQVGEYLREYAAEWRTAYAKAAKVVQAQLEQAQAEAKAQQAREAFEQAMRDPEFRAECERQRAELQAQWEAVDAAEARRTARLTPEQREKIEAQP
jgi:hypothetical protein